MTLSLLLLSFRLQALARLAPWAPAILTAAAVWPIWGYLTSRWLAVDGNLGAALVFILAARSLIVAARQSGPVDQRFPWAAALLLGAYCGAWALPIPLLRTLIGLAAAAAALPGWRLAGLLQRTGLIWAALVSAPHPTTMQLLLGGPMREASAVVAALWLKSVGYVAISRGPILWVNGQPGSVDAPCSGLNGLWTALAAAGILSAERRLGPGRTLLLLGASAVLTVPLNGIRSGVLLLASHRGITEHHPAHTLIGLGAFAVLLGAIYGLAWLLGRRSGKRSAAESSPKTNAPGKPAGIAGLIPLTALCAAMPFAAPAFISDPRPHLGRPNPKTWLGMSLTRMQPTASDLTWAAGEPVARFRLENGEELLIRWIDRPDLLALHPAENCLRAEGHVISPLGVSEAPAPSIREMSGGFPELGREVFWRRFRAQSQHRVIEARSALFSLNGATYTDPSWWYWSVAGPGASDRGPWCSVTLYRSSMLNPPVHKSALGRDPGARKLNSTRMLGGGAAAGETTR